MSKSFKSKFKFSRLAVFLEMATKSSLICSIGMFIPKWFFKSSAISLTLFKSNFANKLPNSM